MKAFRTRFLAISTGDGRKGTAGQPDMMVFDALEQLRKKPETERYMQRGGSGVVRIDHLCVVGDECTGEFVRGANDGSPEKTTAAGMRKAVLDNEEEYLIGRRSAFLYRRGAERIAVQSANGVSAEDMQTLLRRLLSIPRLRLSAVKREPDQGAIDRIHRLKEMEWCIDAVDLIAPESPVAAVQQSLSIFGGSSIRVSIKNPTHVDTEEAKGFMRSLMDMSHAYREERARKKGARSKSSARPNVRTLVLDGIFAYDEGEREQLVDLLSCVDESVVDVEGADLTLEYRIQLLRNAYRQYL